MNDDIILHEPFQLVYHIVQFTDLHVFLTGSAGTGKTYFLQQLSQHLYKRFVILAPTGVAAIQAGGQTIHSFFKLPHGLLLLPDDVQNSPLEEIAFPRWKIELIQQLDTIIIDEVSMLRADVLDAIDYLLKKIRRNQTPYGGVQMIFIGDLFQLPPVVSEQEKNGFYHFYNSPYFFTSRSFSQIQYTTIELETIHRQTDPDFINILENIRVGKITQDDLQKINSRIDPYFDWFFNKDYLVLTTHNKTVEEINQTRLSQLKGKGYHFEALIEGDFPEKYYPTDYNLTLKEGARIMFLKNDLSPHKKYYNGKIGTVKSISDNVLFIETDDEEQPIELERHTWQNIQYKLDLDKMEIQQEVLGSFTQFPIKLAWAMTIHKSQGLTFSKVYLDLQRVFTYGQVYVGLSRCTSLDGLLLRTSIHPGIIRADQQIIEFYHQLHQHTIKPEELPRYQLLYWLKLMRNFLDIDPIHNNIQNFISLEDLHPIDPMLKFWFQYINTTLYPRCQINEFLITHPTKVDTLLNGEKFIHLASEKFPFLIQYTAEVYFLLSSFRGIYSTYFKEAHQFRNLFDKTVDEVINKILLLEQLNKSPHLKSQLLKLLKRNSPSTHILLENKPVLDFDNKKYVHLRWWRNYHLAEMIIHPLLFVSDETLSQLSRLNNFEPEKISNILDNFQYNYWKKELYLIINKFS
ncbi:MAG: AAA family ATPase [Bacteroidales bacterium]|nr:AAA family ATPase [Bacteroidales bacterium]